MTTATVEAGTNLSLNDFFAATEGGKIFTVEFYKRTDGSLRVMNCRRGVQKGVKGVGMAYNPAEKNLLVVYDMQKLEEGKDEKGAFRMINLSDLKTLKMNGAVYNWDADTQNFVAQ